MAHIISCMLNAADVEGLGIEPYMAKATSPQPLNERADSPSSSPDKSFVWRMQPERKYQLFPKDKQPAPVPGKTVDPEQALTLASGQNGEKTDKASSGGNSGAIRMRIKEYNLTRRRKVSVPELGPMTTVQEVAMDSPTIPGRPPLHERSISAPGNTLRQHRLAESISYDSVTPPNEHDELTTSKTTLPTESKQPLSPKSLAPLVIPTQSPATSRLTKQSSLSRLRSGSHPTDSVPRTTKADDSPLAKTPYTPLSASSYLTTPRSAVPSSATTVMTASTIPSAPPTAEARLSPHPWADVNYALTSLSGENLADQTVSPKGSMPRSASALGHRRNQSESATSIMERGRPRKRGDASGKGALKGIDDESKRSKSAERRAFEQLPKGWKASEASSVMKQSEMISLQRQAIQQASKFEVLKKEDVDNLSSELRHLDERTEYLRRTYTSLRAGRRNLHGRICQYLRSPRTAKFSHDSMLKQEEALAELDASIDDWANKLDQAENRRTRVRQKLLEHVAAAATISLGTGIAGVSESLQLAMGVRGPQTAGDLSTPPRSPTKVVFLSRTESNSPSPSRAVAHVPSTILEQPAVEEASTSLVGMGVSAEDEGVAAALRRQAVESIRVYAHSDVYALLADVENEISKMSGGDAPSANDASMTDVERRKLHRARSHEVLSGAAFKASTTNLRAAPTAVKAQDSSAKPQPAKEEEEGEELFLTSAVFQPEKSVLAL